MVTKNGGEKSMKKLEIAGIGTILALAISLITAGVEIIETNLYAGVALLVVGIALILVWVYLLEKGLLGSLKK